MKPRGRIVVLPVHLDENTAKQIDKLLVGNQEAEEDFVRIAMAYGLYEPYELLAETPVRIINRKELMVAVTQAFSEVLRAIGIQTASARGALACLGYRSAELHFAELWQ